MAIAISVVILFRWTRITWQQARAPAGTRGGGGPTRGAARPGHPSVDTCGRAPQ
jgi:hypothetical protein